MLHVSRRWAHSTVSLFVYLCWWLQVPDVPSLLRLDSDLVTPADTTSECRPKQQLLLEAAQLYREAVSTLDALLGKTHPDSRAVKLELAGVLIQLGEQQEATEIYNEVLPLEGAHVSVYSTAAVAGA